MKIGVFVAHPDDEIIGIGGTIAKHVKEYKDEVEIYIMCEGKSSRLEKYVEPTQEKLNQFANETYEACECIGVTKEQIRFFDLPDNRLDSLARLDVIKIIENIGKKEKFDIVYTHNIDDLNIDHKIVAESVLTAFRALPEQSVKEIIMFETLSSTEHAMFLGNYFEPNMFVDIRNSIEDKLKALSCYKSELRQSPHPRNIEAVRCNAILWGNKVGINAAEAFRIARIMR